MIAEPAQRQHQGNKGRLTKVSPFQVGPYWIGWQLGEGGMGTVYVGYHMRSKERAAIKLIRRDRLDDPVFRERFRQEVAAARRVPRFCTARVLDADLDADQPWLAIEFIDAPDLNQVLSSGRPLTGAALEAVAVGVAGALREIHAHGVIHRDLKPANVLLSRLGPRVIDFGIARVAGDDTQPDFTTTGQVIGTRAYMSPEQLREEELTPAVDVFAWGAVVATAANCRPPFGVGDAAIGPILTEEPDLGDLAEPLRGLVVEALDKDPDQRPSAAELVRRLSAVGSETTTEVLSSARADHSPVRRKRRQRLAGAAILAATVALVIAVVAAVSVLRPADPLPLAGETISIGVFHDWDEGIAATFLWKAALEAQGAEVTIRFDDVAVVYAQVAAGELDLAFDAWLPHTHATYWQVHGDQLEDLGSWFDGAALRIAVNDDAPIDSLTELAGAADEFGNRLLGIEAAAGHTEITAEQVIPAYGLQDMLFLVDSTSRMLLELRSAIEQGENVVVTLWEPHWAYLAYDIRNLEDPAGALGEPERIHAFARPGFTGQQELIAGWVSTFTMSDPELTTLQSTIFHEHQAATDDEFETAVQQWLATRPGYLDRLTID